MKKEEHVDSTANVIKKKTFRQGLPIFNDNAAGIDVGDTMYDVAISESSTDNS